MRRSTEKIEFDFKVLVSERNCYAVFKTAFPASAPMACRGQLSIIFGADKHYRVGRFILQNR